MVSRSFHFIPAHQSGYFSKIKELNADFFIFDLEDGVPQTMKEKARDYLLNLPLSLDFKKILIRINAIGSTEYVKDIQMLQRLPYQPKVVLPKVEKKKQVKKFLQDQSKTSQVMILVESLQGLMNLHKIAKLKEVFAIGIGMEDLLAAFPMVEEELNTLKLHLRMQALFAAKAFDKLIIDTISHPHHDHAELEKECRQIRALGFDGKFSIHPRQIETINSIFAIDEKLVDWAKKIKDKTNLQTGFGYTKVENELITPPMIAKAKRILNSLMNNQDGKEP